MNITKDKITEIFNLTDEFCINFKKSIQGHILGNAPKKKPIMSESEVIIYSGESEPPIPV